jgi:hypothetical protein
MSDTIVDVKVDFDIMLLSQLFDLVRPRQSDPAAAASTIATLLYAAALVSEEGPKIDEAEFVKMAQEAVAQAQSATKGTREPSK